MVLGHVKGMKNPGDRAREYAKATNSLLSTDSGMVEWYTFIKAKCEFTIPGHGVPLSTDEGADLQQHNNPNTPVVLENDLK
jgi:hypothetical protein